jgi:hypothetical protein
MDPFTEENDTSSTSSTFDNLVFCDVCKSWMCDTQNIGCCSGGGDSVFGRLKCAFKVEAMHGNHSYKLDHDNYLCPKCFDIYEERIKALGKDYTSDEEDGVSVEVIEEINELKPKPTNTEVTLSQVKEALNDIFSVFYSVKKDYKENFGGDSDPDNIPIEQLESHKYKSFRILDDYFTNLTLTNIVKEVSKDCKTQEAIITNGSTFKVLSNYSDISKEFEIEHDFYNKLTVFFDNHGHQCGFHFTTLKNEVVWNCDLDLCNHRVYERNTYDEFDEVFIALRHYDLKEDESVCEFDNW